VQARGARIVVACRLVSPYRPYHVLSGRGVVVLYDSVKIPRCRSRSRNMNDLFAIYLRPRAAESQSRAARVIISFSRKSRHPRRDQSTAERRFGVLCRVKRQAASGRRGYDPFVSAAASSIRKIPLSSSRDLRRSPIFAFLSPAARTRACAWRKRFIVSRRVGRFPQESQTQIRIRGGGEYYTRREGVCTFYDGARTVSHGLRPRVRLPIFYFLFLPVSFFPFLFSSPSSRKGIPRTGNKGSSRFSRKRSPRNLRSGAPAAIAGPRQIGRDFAALDSIFLNEASRARARLVENVGNTRKRDASAD